MSQVEIIDTDAGSICDHGFCGFRDRINEGHLRKTNWLKKRFSEGLKFKVLQVDGEDVGMIEYIPGEYCWRPVDAAGYFVIHCIMIQKRKHKGKGFGSRLIETCVEDARRSRSYGVAVVTSSGSWMASGDIFRRCGFTSADTAPPSFELLVKPLRKAPLPQFRKNRRAILRKYASGLTIIKSDQCPCIAKGLNDILQVCKNLEIVPRIVELRSGRQARSAPSPYGVFNVVYDGQVVADHPIGGTRFRNIMHKIDIAGDRNDE